MPYIYKISNIINDKVYIGKTLHSIESRWNEHKNDCKRFTDEKRALYSAMRKYGIDKFNISLVEECSIDIINEREKYWIDKFNSYKKGYNCTLGGEGIPTINRDEVIKNFFELKSCKKVAKKMHIGVDSVSRILKENKINGKMFCNNKNKKQVVMIDLYSKEEKEFDSIDSASSYLLNNNISHDKYKTSVHKHIRDVCNHKRITAYGHKWKWKMPD